MEAKIVLNDEVMAHIHGLDLATRKKLHEKFKFEIPGTIKFKDACACNVLAVFVK
jgi:hypothetical protein